MWTNAPRNGVNFMGRRTTYRIATLVGLCILLGTTISATPLPVTGIERVSVSSTGVQGEHWSSLGSISADGRYVAFHTMANNFLDIDQNDTKADVFVHDRQAKSTTLVSMSSNGTQGNESSSDADISANGRYVAFSSWARNLAPEASGYGDVYVHDRQTKQTVQISVASDGTPADEYSGSPSISDDGRFVAFSSKARNLVSNDTVYDDVFIHDRDTDSDGMFDEPGAIRTARVSQASDGTPAEGNSDRPQLSDDGRYIVFSSSAKTLTPEGMTPSAGVFLHDFETGETIQVSPSSNDYISFASISGDGRYISFVQTFNVYVYDRLTKQTVLVSPLADKQASDGGSGQAYLSRTGRYVTFPTNHQNVVGAPSDIHSAAVLYDRDTDNDGIFDEAEATATTVVAPPTDGHVTPMYSMNLQLSGSGRYIAFNSEASTLVANDTNADLDVFVRDQQMVQFSDISYQTDEQAKSATITVTLASFEGTVTVNFATSGGSATPGDDYQAISGTLTFDPGETTKTFNIPLFDDVRSEIRETVLLTLSGPTNAVLGDRAQATLTINASEGVYLPSVRR